MRYFCLIHSRYVIDKPMCQSHLYDILLLVVGYIYNFMSTQAADVIEEGVEGVDDALIDSLIDAVHFDDLVLEKDVADIDQIEAFCTYYLKHAAKITLLEFVQATSSTISDNPYADAW